MSLFRRSTWVSLQCAHILSSEKLSYSFGYAFLVFFLPKTRTWVRCPVFSVFIFVGPLSRVRPRIGNLAICCCSCSCCGESWVWVHRWVSTRAVESGSREKSINQKKSDKIGSDFLSDFLAKMPKCHKLPQNAKMPALRVRVLHQNILIFNIFNIFKCL